MKYHTIIWDWNGTLLRDAQLCRSVMNELLKKRQMKTLSRARYETLFDFPVTTYYEKLGFDFTRESFEDLGNDFMRGYETHRHQCRLQPGTRRLLHTLRTRGIEQAILSAYRQDSLESLLETKKLTGCFSLIFGTDDHYARGKTEQARRLITRLSSPRHGMVMIGDTRHDVEVARAMNVECVLVYGGHQSMTRLAEIGCRVFKNFQGLSEWLMETT